MTTTLTRYKLATRERTTHGGYKLPPNGEWFYPADRNSEPRACSNTVLHHYTHPLLAVLFNPIHGNYIDPVLFEIEIDEEIGTDGFKGWCRAQRIVREIPLPTLTTEQRIAFAIYCAEPFEQSNAWCEWAVNWMNGTNRTEKASKAAWAAAAARAAAAAAAARAAAAAAEAGQPAPDFLTIIQRVIETEDN